MISAQKWSTTFVTPVTDDQQLLQSWPSDLQDLVEPSRRASASSPRDQRTSIRPEGAAATTLPSASNICCTRHVAPQTTDTAPPRRLAADSQHLQLSRMATRHVWVPRTNNKRLHGNVSRINPTPARALARSLPLRMPAVYQPFPRLARFFLRWHGLRSPPRPLRAALRRRVVECGRGRQNGRCVHKKFLRGNSWQKRYQSLVLLQMACDAGGQVISLRAFSFAERTVHQVGGRRDMPAAGGECNTISPPPPPPPFDLIAGIGVTPARCFMRTVYVHGWGSAI